MLDARLDPGRCGRRRHREGGKRFVLSGRGELRLDGCPPRQAQAQAVVPGAGDRERVDGFAHGSRGTEVPDPLHVHDLDRVTADVAVRGQGTAVPPRERREGHGRGVVDSASLLEKIQSLQDHSGPLGVRDGGGGLWVSVEREEGEGGDRGEKGGRAQRAHVYMTGHD
ncbi:MAG: hypothetical protein A2V74_00595 [Acidobacteria bacterium RBG_16_70_10]|nr:MAG: hypothetical protein A2V74_00595 [Acidobacteria bacterium RBG_16_70_10]